MKVLYVYVELKYYEIENLIKTYYETQNINDINVQKEKECDLVSLRIAQLLEDKSFGFSPITLKNIHKYLFKDIYNFAGNYRNYNITKKEPILNGETVKYVNYQDIESYFDYDFKDEKDFDYSNLNNDELIMHYRNIPKGIYPTLDYLVLFFEDLLQCKSNDLINRDLYITELFKN